MKSFENYFRRTFFDYKNSVSIKAMAQETKQWTQKLKDVNRGKSHEGAFLEISVPQQ